MSLVDFESNRLFGFELALLCVTTKPYTLTDLYIFSSIQNYSLKKNELKYNFFIRSMLIFL